MVPKNYFWGSNGETDIENRLMDMGIGEGEMYGESNMETYITICKMDSHGNLLYVSGNSMGLCINLEGWHGEGNGSEAQKGGDMYTYN